MSVLLRRETERLRQTILGLTALVEDNCRKAVRALSEKDADLARQVRHTDAEIDQAEMEVEEECLKILALHQPVAFDLRYVVSILKIDNELERIGDLAVNIAKVAEYFNTHEAVPVSDEIARMADRAIGLVKESLDAFVALDADGADRVCAADDEVDAMRSNVYEHVVQAERENPERADCWVRLFQVAYYLERMADHATNIAEDTIYLSQGRIVRHGGLRESDSEEQRPET